MYKHGVSTESYLENQDSITASFKEWSDTQEEHTSSLQEWSIAHSEELSQSLFEHQDSLTESLQWSEIEAEMTESLLEWSATHSDEVKSESIYYSQLIKSLEPNNEMVSTQSPSLLSTSYPSSSISHRSSMETFTSVTSVISSSFALPCMDCQSTIENTTESTIENTTESLGTTESIATTQDSSNSIPVIGTNEFRSINGTSAAKSTLAFKTRNGIVVGNSASSVVPQWILVALFML